MVAIEKFSDNKRVLQTRTSNDNIVFNDADFSVSWTINKTDRTTVGSVNFTFDNNQEYIAYSFNYGNNSTKVKIVNSSMSFSKNMNINEDENGAGNGSNLQIINSFIYCSNREDVTKLTISQSSNGIQSLLLKILKNFPNLNSLAITIPQAPNWSFLNEIPIIKVLQFQIATANWENTTYLKNSGLIALSLMGYNLDNLDLMSVIPSNLKYLRITQMPNQIIELGNFFNGNRIGFSLTNNINAVNTINYNVNAVFPSVINPIADFTIDYILSILNIPNKMSADKVAKFIVDFANQVTACNLPTSSKRIRFQSHTVNTSYTDNSQPLFKTYASALNHITSTLGITVTFT